jgi:hypothetical protein
MGKHMAEDMRDNGKSDYYFLGFTGEVSNEAPVKWRRRGAVPEYNKFDWYVYPFMSRNRPLSADQDDDVRQCTYNSYFSNVLANTRYLLIKKEKNYFAYESMASCWEPSLNSSRFLTTSPIYSEANCMPDEKQWNTFFYSATCRGWYREQK